MLTFTPDRLRQVGQAIFEAAGAPPDIAQLVAESLVDANLAGHDSHGVMRIPQYLQDVKQGLVVPDARPRVERDAPSWALVDGCWAFGQVSATFAADQAIEKARRAGVAAVGLVRATHIGRLGAYSERAATSGVVAMVVAGGFGGRGAAPYGGAATAFGTNPISFGFPAGDEPDVLVDFATTAVAAGKIRVAQAKREPLPPGCLIDREGRPTTDPEEYYRGGMLLPFGGHKGYGLAVAIELLGQCLTGADAFAEEGKGGPAYGRSGALFIALDAGLFRPREEYERSADAFLRRVRAVPPAPGFAEVLLPGDPERRASASRGRNGIPLPEATWEAILAAGRGVGLNLE